MRISGGEECKGNKIRKTAKWNFGYPIMRLSPGRRELSGGASAQSVQNSDWAGENWKDQYNKDWNRTKGNNHRADWHGNKWDGHSKNDSGQTARGTWSGASHSAMQGEKQEKRMAPICRCDMEWVISIGLAGKDII